MPPISINEFDMPVWTTVRPRSRHYFQSSLYVVVDTTRVTIREADPDVPGSDYINANYIKVSHVQVKRLVIFQRQFYHSSEELY